MFWCPLVGANRPPTKQAMPVARQVICVCVSFGRSLCRYNSPFHAVKKGHYRLCLRGRVDVLVFFTLVGADRPPREAMPVAIACLE